MTGSNDSSKENTYQGRGTNRNTTEINAGWGSLLGLHVAARWEISSSRPTAKNGCGENNASKLTAHSNDPGTRLPRKSSHRMEAAKTKKSNPKMMGTSSQSLKNRMTRHLTARSRWTGSLTSSENRQTIVRRRAQMWTKQEIYL